MNHDCLDFFELNNVGKFGFMIDDGSHESTRWCRQTEGIRASLQQTLEEKLFSASAMFMTTPAVAFFGALWEKGGVLCDGPEEVEVTHRSPDGLPRFAGHLWRH